VLRCENTWPATPEHVSDARACVADLAIRAGVPEATVDGVRLAVSEAVSNVVVHGYRGRRVGDVTVTAEAEDDHLRVVVRDEGCGLAPRSDSPGAGLGLPLIAKVAESISVSPGRDGRGTVVCMTFDVHQAVAG
jgi:serine/threonine-protein kinase RsbW/stage II sporulation protein AB (anti-sigma F factor)